MYEGDSIVFCLLVLIVNNDIHQKMTWFRIQIKKKYLKMKSFALHLTIILMQSLST